MAKSFGSPLFLVIAIFISVISALTLAAWIANPVDVLSLLGFIFSSLSGMFAWFLYGGLFGESKVRSLRLHFAYSKVINTITLVLVSSVGAIILAVCLILSLMSGVIKDTVVPKLEQDIKPLLEQALEYGDKMGEFAMEDVDAMLEDVGITRQELAKFGVEINDVEDVKRAVAKAAELADPILENWDDIMEFLTQGFAMLTIIVAVVYVFAIVALALMGGAYNRVCIYLKGLGGNKRAAKKKAPFVILFIGGTLSFAFGCTLLALRSPISAVAKIIEGGVFVMLALFFKQLKSDMASEKASEEIADVQGAVLAESEPMAEQQPMAQEAPAEEAPTEEAPAEEAPAPEINAVTDETPVE